MEPTSPRISQDAVGGSRMDFEVFLNLIFSGRRAIVFLFTLTVAATLILSLLTPRTYESTAQILAEPQKEDNPYSLELRSQKDRQLFLETQKELVVSQSVIQRALSKITSKPEAQLREKDVRDFQGQISVKSRSGMGKNPFGGNGIGESNVFFVSAREGDAKSAAFSVNAVVQSYLDETARIRTEQAQQALKMLEGAVDDMRKHTQGAHERLVAFESEAGSLLPELMNIDKPTVRVYPELEKLRSEYESQRAEVERKRILLGSLDKALAESSGVEPALPSEIVMGNPSVTLLKSKLADLCLQRNALEPFYQPESREIQSLDQQIAQATESLRREVTRIAQGEHQTLAAMESSQAERGKSLAEYDAKMTRLSEMNSRHAEIKREYVSSAKALETQMSSLAAARMAAAERSSRGANISVIHWGSAPSRAISPRLFRNLLVSLPLGLALGILLVLLHHALNPTYIHPRQAERTTGLPVVACCPSLPAEGGQA